MYPDNQYPNGAQPQNNVPQQPNYVNNMYGAPVPPQQYVPAPVPPKPEAPKTPSKNKEKGVVVAWVITAISVLIAIVAIIYVFATKDFNPNDYTTTQTTQAVQNNSTINQTGSDKVELNDGKLTASEVYEKVYKSSVAIIGYSKYSGSMVGHGSGVVYKVDEDKGKTYIITCAHVVEGTRYKFQVQDYAGRVYDALVVGYDSRTDIGVISISTTENMYPAEFAEPNSLKVGDAIYAIGVPHDLMYFGSFTDGMVSALNRPIDYDAVEYSHIQHTVPINPGNSGGALVDAYGKVVGINSAKIATEDVEGMGFSVQISTTLFVADELIANGKVKRAGLGVTVSSAMQDETCRAAIEENDLPVGAVKIESIDSDSDLYGKDIKAGDMIIAVNGTDIDAFGTFASMVSTGKIGDVLKLKVCRINSDGSVSTFTVNATLVDSSKLN